MMKIIKFGFVSLISLFAIAACNTGVETCIDPVTGEICDPPPVPVYPAIIKIDTAGFLTKDIFVQPSEEIFIRLKGTRGDTIFKTLEIRQNGELLAASRMTVDGSQLSNNPYDFGDNKLAEFIWDVGLIVQDAKDKVQYEFILEDRSGRQAITDIIVNTLINDQTPPTIELLSEETPTIIGEGVVTFEFEVDAIGSPVEFITVYQASELLPEGRLKFDGEPFSSNPLPLSGADRDGFTKTIEILSNPESGIQGFTVIFQDSLGVDYTHELGILVIKPVEEFKGLTLNTTQGAGSTRGGLDLDALAETAADNMNAEIKDAGFSQNIWNQKFISFNDSALAKVSDQVDFDLIENDNQIKDLWQDSEKAPSLPGADKEFITLEKVQVGDKYIVKKVEDYYLLRITEVNTVNMFFKMDLKK